MQTIKLQMRCSFLAMQCDINPQPHSLPLLHLEAIENTSCQYTHRGGGGSSLSHQSTLPKWEDGLPTLPLSQMKLPYLSFRKKICSEKNVSKRLDFAGKNSFYIEMHEESAHPKAGEHLSRIEPCQGAYSFILN